MSAPIGSGHQMAADALVEALSRLKDVEVVQGNVFAFFPSVLGRFFLNSYARILQYCPGLYALSYRWGNQSNGSLWMRNLINAVLLRLGRSFIKTVHPDFVFSTHATPTGIFSLYKQTYDSDLWLGVVVTDFTVHRWLLCPGVDAYFLADEKLFPQVCGHTDGQKASPEPAARYGLLQSGNERDGSGTRERWEEAGLYAFGIPVRAAFACQKESANTRKEVRARFGWDEDAFVCLFAGGGAGMLPMEELLQQLRHADLEMVHVVAVTGHNEPLRRKLTEREASFWNSRLAVLGFTDEMPQLMQAADIVITKAGGVSLAECLACGTEFVIYQPLPGQEQANAAFVQKEYAIKVAVNANELADRLRQAAAVSPSVRIQSREQRRQAYGHADAAERIADLLQ